MTWLAILIARSHYSRCFRVRRGVAGCACSVRANIHLQRQRLLCFLEIKTKTRLVTAGRVCSLLHIAEVRSKVRVDSNNARHSMTELRIKVKHGVRVQNGGWDWDISSSRMHVIWQARSFWCLSDSSCLLAFEDMRARSRWN